MTPWDRAAQLLADEEILEYGSIEDVEAVARAITAAVEEAWQTGVRDAAEALRRMWDDGPQGNCNDAAELVILADLAEHPELRSQQGREGK